MASPGSHDPMCIKSPCVCRSHPPQHQCFDRLLDPPWTSWGQLGPAGASWYNTLKLASCHVHRPCPNPLQSPHRVMTSKQESSTSLVSQFGKSVKCLLYD